MSSLVGGIGIIGQDMICSFSNGKYKTFEGTEISIENCVKAKVKDLVVEGKTYQNLVSNLNELVGNVYTTSKYASIPTKMFKTNTIYTVITTINESVYSSTKFGALLVIKYTTIGDSYIPISLVDGTFKIKFTTGAENPTNIRLQVHGANDTTSSFKLDNLVILEGDYTNIDLPNSINGIESVGERENINLLKDIKWYDGFINMTTGELEGTNSSYPNAKYTDLINIDSSILYITNLPQNSSKSRIRTYSEDGTNLQLGINTFYELYKKDSGSRQKVSKIRILMLDSSTIPENSYLIKDGEDINNPYPLKLKINDNTTTLNLPIPLRSLPNGTCDTIEGNKLVQRVGKIILDGTQVMTLANVNQTETTRVRIVMNNAKISNKNKNNLICNWYIRTGSHGDYEYIIIQDSSAGICLFISVSNSKLDTVDLNGIEKYFKENPLIVYYELATPIIHDLEIPQLNTSKGTNIITTENNIKPNMTMKVKVKK